VPEEVQEQANVKEESIEREISETVAETVVDPCPRLPALADRERKVVISLPYDEKAQKVGNYEVFTLSASGELRRPQVKFKMGIGMFGEIIFTPDGEVGLVALENGTIGVFRFDSEGKVHVVHEAFKGKFYASSLAMDPSGKRAYVVDVNWRNNGGGIYSVGIGCDGTLTDEGQLAPSKLARAMLLFGNTTPQMGLVAARDILSSPANTNVHLLDMSAVPALIDSVDAFGDDEAIISAAAITLDGRFGLFGDNNIFSGIPNRVAIAEITNRKLQAHRVISPIKDPAAIVASVYNNAIMIASGEGNAIYNMSYNPSASTPFGTPVAVTYKGPSPKLPGAAHQILRGSLTGRVLISENVGIRQLQFEQSGQLTDLGSFDLGSGYTSIVGVIGVQP
jgi:hypothetical protein